MVEEDGDRARADRRVGTCHRRLIDVFLAGSFIGEHVANWIGLGDTWTTVWSVLRWPLIAILLIVALAFFYWAGPNVDAPFKWLTPGSVLAVLLWGVATFTLSIYFQYFGGYVEAYGALGGVLAFVFWLYVMSLILLLGGELNAVVALMYDPKTQAEVADPARAGSGVKTRRAAGTGAAPSGQPVAATGATVPDAPAANPFLGAWAPWPSAEREARRALAAEGSAGRRRRFRSAVTALGVSIVSAVSAAIFGARRR